MSFAPSFRIKIDGVRNYKPDQIVVDNTSYPIPVGLRGETIQGGIDRHHMEQCRNRDAKIGFLHFTNLKYRF